MIKLDFTHATDVKKTCPVCILQLESKQWGFTAYSSDGNKTVTFPVSFATDCYAFIKTNVTTSSADATFRGVGYTSKSKTSAVYYMGGSSSLNYIAIGK